MKELTIQQVNEYFTQGLDCAQVVALCFADEVHIDEALLLRMASPFGGGQFQGNTCGSVTGAYLILGLLYGHDAPHQHHKKELLISKMMRFNELFLSRETSLVCKELLGFDLTQPDEMKEIEKRGLMFTTCPASVVSAIHALQQVIAE